MSLSLQPLRLAGRHVLLLVCLVSVLARLVSATFEFDSIRIPSDDAGCYDADRNISRASGEQWLLADCGGVAHCGGGYIVRSSCPEPAECRRIDDGDATATFPRCCPRLACDLCHSEQLGRQFSLGSHWTESPCVKKSCQLSGSDMVDVRVEMCEPLGPPPSLDCEVMLQDESRGEFPLCCARYRCPGLCRSGGRWVSVGHRGDSCHEPAGDTDSGSWGPW
ncbi:hypothetical protein FJT64_020038 [Amphibalanus amphitrite]|uniref:Single domain-containing protein n=1 Tax=Amphibalanus amphitrite TaxID=1232801 RepID=A0A6A4WRV0_AMPAM|nr:hypothetical protein FJT64_020038 [Amphibalanus amphitrite]